MKSPLQALVLLALPALAACGGSEPSHPIVPEPGAPVPVLESLSPGLVDTDRDTVTLTLRGHDFQATSLIQWNGSALPTTFIDSTTLTSLVIHSRLAHGVMQVTVRTPAPGGGTSSALPFTVAALTPEVDSLGRISAQVAEAGVVLRVFGSRFMPSSVLLWGDSVLTTSHVGGELTASIPSTLIGFDTTVSIRVRTPEPGGGTSASLPFHVTPDLRARTYDVTGMAYSQARNQFYLSTSPTSESFVNTLLAFSPATGEMTRVLLEGAFPGKLALSTDGTILFVELGSNGDVGIYDLVAMQLVKTFSLGSDPDLGVRRVDDFAVIPGSPRSVAVSMRFPNVSPRHAGVAVFDNGVLRGTPTPRHTGPTSLAFGGSPDRLFGIDGESGDGSIYSISVTAAGPVVTTVTPGLLWGDELVYSGGRLYAQSGDIVDAATLSHVGSFGTPPDVTAGFSVDSANGRAFFYRTGGTLQAYDLASQESLRSFIIPDFSSEAGCQPLMRWSTNGLVLHCRSSIYLLRSGLVAH